MTHPPDCLPDDATHHLDLPFTPQSARVARARLLESMCDVLDETRREDARLVVSELVGNSVRHGRPLADGTVRVTWRHSLDMLHIAVTDGGAPTRPQARRAGVSDLGGRGLGIVETLAAGWWVESSPARTTVHAQLSLA